MDPEYNTHRCKIPRSPIKTVNLINTIPFRNDGFILDQQHENDDISIFICTANNAFHRSLAPGE